MRDKLGWAGLRLTAQDLKEDLMRELVPATRRVRSQRHGARIVKKTTATAIEKRKTILMEKMS